MRSSARSRRRSSRRRRSRPPSRSRCTVSARSRASSGRASCGWALRRERFRPARCRPASRPRSSAAGIPRERQAWHPHLTIGRVFDERAWRREAGLPLRQALAAAARRSFGTLAVSHLALMRSDLSPQGARYRELASAELTPGRSGPSACGRPAGPREADMTNHLEAQQRAGTSVAVHDGFEGGAAGVAAWLPALNTTERPVGVRDRVPASAFRRVIGGSPLSLSASALARLGVDRIPHATGASGRK